MQLKHYSLEMIAALPFPPEAIASRPAPDEASARAKMEEIFKDGVLLNKPTVLEVNGIEYVGDGHRRFAAIKLAIKENDPRLAGIGLADGMDLQVWPVSEAKALLLQVSGNVNVKPQTNAEYAKALCKIMALDPTMTREQLAKAAGLSQAKFDSILSLLKLPENVQTLNNEGKIELTKAVALARVPQSLITEEVIQAAVSQDVNSFLVTLQTEVEKDRATKRENTPKRTGPKEFVPTKKLLSSKELDSMLVSAEQMFEAEPSESNKARLETMKEVWSLDERTLTAKKAEWDKAQADAEAKKVKAAADLAAKKLAEYQASQAAILEV